jgi:hypothetical protein
MLMLFTEIIAIFPKNHMKTQKMPWTKHKYFIAKVFGKESIGPPLLKRIMLRVYNTVRLNE